MFAMLKLVPEPDGVKAVPAGRFMVLAALVLTLAFPANGHSQANRERERLRQPQRDTPSWLECFAPNECEVRVFVSAFHGRKGRLRLLSERAASACHAAGYSHYVAGTPSRVDAGIGRVTASSSGVYFTQDSEPPARPCSFSATSELEGEAREMAKVNGYPWPVEQVPREAEQWTFKPGENDWGEAPPDEDVIASPVVPALRSDQGDLVGILLLTRDCAVAVGVVQQGVEPQDPWALTEGGSDTHDRVLEVRVDGTSVREQGHNVTEPTAGMVASSSQTFGVAVRSVEHQDNAAFEWTVTDRDQATIRERSPHCVGSR